MFISSKFKKHQKRLLTTIAGSLFIVSATAFAEKEGAKPNFLIVLVDDVSAKELSCYGSEKNQTLTIDSLAKQGVKLTQCYTQENDVNSRIGIHTGSYVRRVSSASRERASPLLMHSKEWSLSKMLYSKKYHSMYIGRWEVSGEYDRAAWRKGIAPIHHGAREFLGTAQGYQGDGSLLKNGAVAKQQLKQGGTVAERYTKEALDFMKRVKKPQPFSLIVSYPSMNEEQGWSTQRKVSRSQYIQNLDHSVKKLLGGLEKNDLDENTYIIFLSDGSSRQAKGSTFYYHLQVPFIIDGSRVRSNKPLKTDFSVDVITSAMDLLPVVDSLSEKTHLFDRVLDGKDITHLLRGVKPNVVDKARSFILYENDKIMGVLRGEWQLLLGENERVKLYNLSKDRKATRNVASQNSKEVIMLKKYVDWARKDIGEQDLFGKNGRAYAGRPPKKKK